MQVTAMTRQQIDAVPLREDWSSHVECKSLIILPTRRKHDSGYRCMDFLAVDASDKPICRLSGCSDVLHIDGIGGFGKPSNYNFVVPKGWSIDCLGKSGLLRIFGPKTITATEALSSFCVFGDEAR